jgi:glycosyltransferase involved in cell wall biosynthesis
MPETKKVSILIPCYNSEAFLADTINSAINQTLKNIDIIILDDGSTDNSFQIAKSFASNKVKVIQQENSGACAARNKAFELSTGDYIQYLDADDLLSENKITEQMNLFEKYGDEIVVSCQWDRFKSDPEEATFPQRFLDEDWESPIDWLVNSWEGNGMMAQHAWLTPRSLIEKAGPWDVRLNINQDGEFFSRVLLQSKAIKFCPDAKVYYRSGNPESISKKASRAKAESLLLSYQLYVKNTLPKVNNENVRHALMINFLGFIYRFNDSHPDLSSIARQEIKKLGFDNLPVYGGKNFKAAAKILGFENTLKLRAIITKLVRNRR